MVALVPVTLVGLLDALANTIGAARNAATLFWTLSVLMLLVPSFLLLNISLTLQFPDRVPPSASACWRWLPGSS